MSKTHDYFRLVDLNPAIGGAVIDPRDPRALHFFTFLADGQHIGLASFTATSGRVLYSFDDDHQVGGTPPLPALPMPGQVEVHGVLVNAAPPGLQEARYTELHERRSVRVWLDPSQVPPTGQAVEAFVKAWAKQ